MHTHTQAQKKERKKDTERNRQIDRQTNRQIQTERKKERKKEREIKRAREVFLRIAWMTKKTLFQVFIPGVSADMMNLIIEYAYTRECQVTSDNVERLLPAADQVKKVTSQKVSSPTGLEADDANGI